MFYFGDVEKFDKDQVKLKDWKKALNDLRKSIKAEPKESVDYKTVWVLYGPGGFNTVVETAEEVNAIIKEKTEYYMFVIKNRDRLKREDPDSVAFGFSSSVVKEVMDMDISDKMKLDILNISGNFSERNIVFDHFMVHIPEEMIRS